MLPIAHDSYKSVRIVLTVFFLVNAVVLLALPLLPFIDLPNHLAEATVYKFYGEDGNVLSQYYAPTPWYFPNTFHTVFCSLFPDVEFGNKVFHLLYLAILLSSLYLVIKQLKGNIWYGLLGLLFTYNYNLTYGFVGFAISIPTLFLLFYFILRDFEKNSIALKATIAFLLIVLFLMHAQNALFGLLLFGVMTLIEYRTSLWKAIIRGALIPLPLIALIFTWWFNRGGEREESTSAYLVDYYKEKYFPEFLMRFRLPVFDHFQLQDGIPGLIIAGILFVLIFIPILWLKPWRYFSQQDFIETRMIYPLLLFLTAFGCYIILPDKLPGQSPLFQRLCTIVLLAFIVLSSVWLKSIETSRLRYFVIASISIYAILWFEYLISFNRANEGFNKDFFSKTEVPSRIAGLIYEHSYRGRKVYIHYPNYFIVWNNGIAASKMIDYRFGVVRRVASETVVPFYHEHVGDGYKAIPTYRSLEYLLVRGTPPVSPDINTENFTLLESAGEWKLYQNGRILSRLD